MLTGLRTAVSPFVLLRYRPTVCLTLATLAALGAVTAASARSVARTCGSVTLSQRSSGHTVTLHPCDRVTIRLKEAFDGGYRWTPTRRPASRVLKLVSNKTVATTPPGAVGGSDTRVLVYRAVGKGNTSLTLTESRPFVPHSQIGHFKLFVHVK